MLIAVSRNSKLTEKKNINTREHRTSASIKIIPKFKQKGIGNIKNLRAHPFPRAKGSIISCKLFTFGRFFPLCCQAPTSTVRDLIHNKKNPSIHRINCFKELLPVILNIASEAMSCLIRGWEPEISRCSFYLNLSDNWT